MGIHEQYYSSSGMYYGCDCHSCLFGMNNQNFHHTRVALMYVKITKIDLQVYFNRIKKYFREKIFPELMAKAWHPKRAGQWMFELDADY